MTDFTYTHRSGIAQNEVRENAARFLFLTEPVGQYFANAVRREFRQAGLSLRDAPCALTGDVHDFATESLGFEVTYITDVTYRMGPAAKPTLHQRNVRVSFKTSKFVVAQLYLTSISKAVADNIGQMLIDPQFRLALAGPCAVAPQAPSPRRPAAPRA